MNATHTPGPWRFATGNISNGIEAYSGKALDKYDNGYQIVALYQSAEPTRLYDNECANALANGRLITAAPDLLAALERLHDDTADYIRINNLGDPYQNQNMRDARAAIAKARGQS